jgi:hypothetical protein
MYNKYETYCRIANGCNTSISLHLVILIFTKKNDNKNLQLLVEGESVFAFRNLVHSTRQKSYFSHSIGMRLGSSQ